MVRALKAIKEVRAQDSVLGADTASRGGVDAIMTDRPTLLREVMQRRGERRDGVARETRDGQGEDTGA
jgi:hypothetical protein